MAETLSPEQSANARKSLTAFLQAVDRVGQKALAEGCGVDDSTVTRDKGNWDRFAKQAAIAGIKFVPIEVRCYLPKTIDSILTLARERMAQLDHVSQLEWDE